MAHASEFSVQEVLQFTLIANDQQLACILRDIVDNSIAINIAAYQQVLLNGGCTLVKIVPGTLGDEGQINQEANAIIALRHILEQLGVNHDDEIVLNVSPADIPRIQALLSGVDNTVLSAYVSSPENIIYEVCDLELAKVVLELPQAEQDLLIAETLNCKEKKCRKICSKKERPDCGKKSKKNACCPSTTCDSSSSSSCHSSSSDWSKKKPHCKPIRKPHRKDHSDDSSSSLFVSWKKW